MSRDAPPACWIDFCEQLFGGHGAQRPDKYVRSTFAPLPSLAPRSTHVIEIELSLRQSKFGAQIHAPPNTNKLDSSTCSSWKHHNKHLIILEVTL